MRPADLVLAKWYDHPAVMVRELFGATPDPWQEDVLEAFPHKARQAMTACKGPGKSTTLAWLGWNFMLTRINARCAALSITADTLRDTLWAELGKWYGKAQLLQRAFSFDAERITQRECPKTWWMSARSYPRSANPNDQATALQGLHEDNALILIDEAGGVPRSVLATAEAVLAGHGDQHIVLAGNPNNQDSALGQAVLNQRHLWDVTEITGDPDDPKRATRVPLQWAREQIDAYGRDNPWVLVNVFGRFPPSGLNTLLSPDEVRDAQRRHYPEHIVNGYPLIIGVDVSRFGDDETVFFPRQGKICFPPLRMRNLDGVQVASHLSRISNERKAASVQIDATGGFGVVYDIYRNMQVNGLPVEFGGKAMDDRQFKNKRAEIWFAMAYGIKNDGWALPPVAELVAGLSSVTYTYALDGRIQLEEKSQVKAKIGRSPDLEDALACTCAHPVSIQAKGIDGTPDSLADLIRSAQAVREYNPYDRYQQEINRG